MDNLAESIRKKYRRDVSTELVGDFLQIISANEAEIRKFAKSQSKQCDHILWLPNRKSDIERAIDNLPRNKEILYTLQHSRERVSWERAWQALSNISRLEAYELMAWLPEIINSGSEKLDFNKDVQHHFRATAKWLISWEFDVVCHENLNLPKDDITEDYADLCLLQYHLCRKITHQLPVRVKPGFLWIMLQACICRKMMKPVEMTKKQMYQHWCKSTKQLEDLRDQTRKTPYKPTNILLEVPQDFHQSILKFDWLVESNALLIAQGDEQFTKDYYNNYLEKLSSFGRKLYDRRSHRKPGTC